MIEKPIFKFALRDDLQNYKQFLPNRAEPKATGWDVRAAMHDHKDLIVDPGTYVKIPLGFRAFCPPGWWYELKPRSSTFAKKYMHALYGTIDETFENELVFAAKYDGLVQLQIKFGEAIGQIIPVKRQEMLIEEVTNEMYDTLCKDRNGIRGAGGFGSTGQ